MIKDAPRYRPDQFMFSLLEPQKLPAFQEGHPMASAMFRCWRDRHIDKMIQHQCNGYFIFERSLSLANLVQALLTLFEKSETMSISQQFNYAGVGRHQHFEAVMGSILRNASHVYKVIGREVIGHPRKLIQGTHELNDFINGQIIKKGIIGGPTLSDVFDHYFGIEEFIPDTSQLEMQFMKENLARRHG